MLNIVFMHLHVQILMYVYVDGKDITWLGMDWQNCVFLPVGICCKPQHEKYRGANTFLLE